MRYADPGTVAVRGTTLRPQPRLALTTHRPTCCSSTDCREGQAAARRRRLQGHRRRRHPRRTKTAARTSPWPVVARAVAPEPGDRQAHHRLVEGAGPQYQVLGRGQTCSSTAAPTSATPTSRTTMCGLAVAAQRLPTPAAGSAAPAPPQIQNSNNCARPTPRRQAVEHGMADWYRRKQERRSGAYRMQQIFYEASPYIVLDYPSFSRPGRVALAGLDAHPAARRCRSRSSAAA